MPWSPVPASDPEREWLLDCLEQCLDELPAESRRLLFIYYGSEKRAKIEARRALAEEMAIPLNALRIRAWRLRARLQAAIEERRKGLSTP